jgi:hypothetical protein
MKTLAQLFKEYNYIEDEFIIYNFYRDVLELSSWDEIKTLEEFVKQKQKMSLIKKIAPTVFRYDINNNKFKSVGYNCRYNYETVTIENKNIVSLLREKVFYSYSKDQACSSCGGGDQSYKDDVERVDAFLNQIRMIEMDPKTLTVRYLFNVARPLSIVKIDALTNMPVKVRPMQDEDIESVLTDELISKMPSDFKSLFSENYISITDPSEIEKGLLEITLFNNSLIN